MIAFVISGVATIALGYLGAVIPSPSDQAAFDQHRIWVIAFGALALVSIIVLAVADFLITRRHRAEVVALSATVSEFIERASRGADAGKPAPISGSATTLRQQAFNVFSAVNDLVQSAGPKPSDDEEYRVTMEYGAGFAALVRAIRVRAQNLLGYTDDVKALIQTFPIGVDNIAKLARALERLANALPNDAPAEPEPPH